jgi:hypothetical protein
MLGFVTNVQVHNFSVGYITLASHSGENESVDFEDKIFTKNRSLYNVRTISGATSSLIGKITEIKPNTKETWPIKVTKASSTLLSLEIYKYCIEIYSNCNRFVYNISTPSDTLI